MKRLLYLLIILAFIPISAQENYSYHGENLPLYTEVEGALSLLWNTLDGEYRYFLKKDNTLVELKNTKEDGDYQEEYKAVIQEYTGSLPSKVKFTKPSLAHVVDQYNRENDPDYVSQQESIQLRLRLGGAVGLTNYPYAANPENSTLPQLAAELEVIDEVKLKRHSILAQFRQAFGSSDYDFSLTELMLLYRFKFVKSQTVDVFVNTKIAGYTYLSEDYDKTVTVNGEQTIVNVSGSDGDFQAPFAFGLGADIALGNGYLTLLYQDIIAANLDDNGEFPIDFLVGYKFWL